MPLRHFRERFVVLCVCSTPQTHTSLVGAGSGQVYNSPLFRERLRRFSAVRRCMPICMFRWLTCMRYTV